MSLDFTDDQSALAQVMAWCHQATSHYLNQCWSRSLSPYGVTRPQCYIMVTDLTHCGRDKMTPVLQMTFSNAFKENRISNKIELKYVAWCVIDNMYPLVQIMASHLIGSSHYLIKWWPSSPTDIYITQPQWVNQKFDESLKITEASRAELFCFRWKIICHLLLIYMNRDSHVELVVL